jgi:hypothetical protein
MRLKSHFVLLFAVLSTIGAFAQQFNQNNGEWNVGTNWSTGSVPSGTGTDVTIAANVNISGGDYVIGNVTQINNNTTITIASGASLTVGSSALYNPPSATTKKNVTYANAGTMTVSGSFYIYGDLIVSNTLTFNITGTVIVYGNITMNNGGDIAVSGSGTLQVVGSLTGANGTHLSTGGSATISVGGGINLGGGNSSISGPAGSITSPGGCSCSGNGTGCNVGGTGGCGNTVLPIELLYFMGETQPGKVVLKWATASELNFDHFSIQRSAEGISFSEIGTVDGHGTTKELHKYSFSDTNPLLGRSYYKLTAIDFDGYSESFKIVTVNTKGGKQASVYPNPIIDNQLFVDFNFSSEKEARAIVTDLTGIQLAQFKLSSTSNVLYLDLKPGTYVIKITSDEFSSVARFMVK